MSGETTAAWWAEATRPARAEVGPADRVEREVAGHARTRRWSPQTNEVSNSSSVARTMIEAATDIAISKSCGVGPHGGPVVDDERDVAAPGVEVLPHEQPAVVGDGHRLGRRPPVDVPQVVAGDVLAQGVEGQVALGDRVGRDALEVAEQAGAERVHRHHRRADQDLDARRSTRRRARASPSGSPRRVVAGPTGITPRRSVRIVKLSSCASVGRQPRDAVAVHHRADRQLEHRRQQAVGGDVAHPDAGGHRAAGDHPLGLEHARRPRTLVRPTRKGSASAKTSRQAAASTASSRQSVYAATTARPTPATRTVHPSGLTIPSGRASAAARRASPDRVIGRPQATRSVGGATLSSRRRDHGLDGHPAELRLGVEQQPVAQHRLGQLLDVVGQHVVAAVGGRPGLGDPDQRQAAAGRQAEPDVRLAARLLGELGDVGEDGRVDVHVVGQAAHLRRWSPR